MAYLENGYQVTRHVCPRNCYDTCGMLAYVRNGKLEKITGDPNHGYTKGKLCSKGYNYIRRVYDPERLQFPMRQIGRGSGRWEQITWDKAIEIIAQKMIELKERYHSTLPLCLNKYSGNFGILHYAVEGMFNSFGPTTQLKGSPCWSAGLDAQFYDMGGNINSDPEEIENAKLILLWGGNPAWTAIHSLPYIYRAQEKGAKVIVIDPLYSQTAKKADWFVQIKPGGDGALALALAKVVFELGKFDGEFIRLNTIGWEEFTAYLEEVELPFLSERCGQSIEFIKELGEMIGSVKPMFIWAGFGLQRHVNGGQNLRAIDALAAMTGNIGMAGGGVHYAHQLTWNFNDHFTKDPGGNRYLNINRFADEVSRIKDVPVKLLWLACRNLLTQDVCRSSLFKELDKLELIVTVDQFLTPTAQYSDIVLPTTTQFEEMDIVPSYWHHWVALNEQAIPPYFEAKSDLEIARLLCKKLNDLRPGTSTFSSDKSPEDFLDHECTETLYAMLGIEHWSELASGARRANVGQIAWEDKKFATASGKFEFFSKNAEEHQNPALPEYIEGIQPDVRYPYWLITAHNQQGLNSQFQNIASKIHNYEAIILIHPQTAQKKGIQGGKLVRVYNDLGSITLKACMSADTPLDILVCYQGWLPGYEVQLNDLNAGLPTDMGELRTGSKGVAFYDVFVNFELA
ncbi:molybdopterin-dependent oxidoreductase [Pelosinus sp. sgz500959]|uniref:molybdopterin-dependent oxidoreductase n=1 Tax=Pelosinus sp. sgz500959 TaxID=3242472 RepID=UPI00366FD761